LGIDRFGVVGWSGGAPYAAAVAAALPDRLTGLCLANSASITYAVGPTEADEEDAHIVEMIELFGPVEATIRYSEEQRAWAEGLLQDPASLIDPSEVPEGDRWLFEDPELTACFFRQLQEGLRQGAIGEASHSIGLLAPWGFSLDEIEPEVHLWHGAQDRWVDLPDFERVANELRHHTLTVWPDVGHFGIAKHWGSVLEAALG
jgi:pimeloyl-ACP methyl ester carboxylesterase